MKNLLTLLTLCFPLFLNAQAQDLLVKRSASESFKSTFQLNASQKISPNDFFDFYGINLGLNANSSMKQMDLNSDTYGFKHYRFKQFHNNIEVYGSNYNLHVKNDRVVNGNGFLIPLEDIDVIPLVNSTDAEKIAQKECTTEKSIFKVISNKLVIVNNNYPFSDGEFVLAYVLELESNSNISESRKIIINAQDGIVIKNFSTEMNCFKDKGKVETLYHGTREIDAEYEETDFVTRDLSRGGGIFLNNVNGVLYRDDDNDWKAGTKDYKNGVHDLFWGLQKTFDFYKTKMNRIGADNASLPIRVNLLDTQVYVNAFWSPTQFNLNFGIGDGGNYGPLTSIDVVGHEFTHGVTQFSSGLEYLYEAGAMNEGFSDIFGKAIEYEFDRDSFNWYVGGRFAATKALAFRNMKDPNPYSCPKYYKGKQWKTGTADNGGVHSNSGVINYWYYLLCTGVEDSTELGKKYNVKRMGFDTTTKLAYTLLTSYLGSTSNYYDAKEASLLIASNWWGACSPEYLNIVEAWKAVGIGTSALDDDIQLINTNLLTTACKDGYFAINSRINNQSCIKEIPVGTVITMSYKLDTFPTVIETYTLDKPILSGSHLDYKFSNSPRIIKAGQSRLYVWMESVIDADTSNNRYSILINRSTSSTDNDFRLNNFTLVGAPCPNSTNEYRANSNATYNGCTVIPSGSDLELLFLFSDSSYTYKFKAPTSIYPQANLNIPNILIPRSFLGVKKVQVILNWINDTLVSNNKLYSQFVMINNRVVNVVEEFTKAQFDSAKIQVYSDSFNVSQILYNQAFSSEAVVMTGGKIVDNANRFIPRLGTDPASTIQQNTKFTTKLYVCADISNIIGPRIEFDLAQKQGSFKFDSVGLPNPKSSASTRVIFYSNNNTNLGSNVITDAEDVLNVQHIAYDIPDKTSFVEITNLCLSGSFDATTGLIDYNGDIVVIDNVVITSLVSTKDLRNLANIDLQPNPSHGNFSLFVKDANSGIVKLELNNSYGQLIWKTKTDATQKRIDLSIDETGTYFLSYWTVDGKHGVKKVVVVD
ncbi:MAG: M4 family metallopeptidase [Saprospiraceae bacterium]